MDYPRIPMLQVRNNVLVLYDQSTFRGCPKHNPFKLVPKSYSGTATSGARKRIKKAIDLLLQFSPSKRIFNPVINRYHQFRLAFVTLTIPDNTKIEAKEAHRVLLKPFIRSISTTPDPLYIWKAELQDRGQLHYHITFNQFVHLKRIKNVWNQRLRKAGLSRKYAQRHGHYHPNSTDIHSVRKIRNFEAYLTKYLSKDPGGKINGKIWDCSTELKQQRFSTEMCYENELLINDAIAKGKAERIVLDHCNILRIRNPKTLLTLQQLQSYNTFVT